MPMLCLVCALSYKIKYKKRKKGKNKNHSLISEKRIKTFTLILIPHLIFHILPRFPEIKVQFLYTIFLI